MRNLCLMNDFYFISNGNISIDFIFQDDVYVSKDGTCILVEYFVDFVSAIKNFWLKRNPEIVGKTSSAWKLQTNLELTASITQKTEKIRKPMMIIEIEIHLVKKPKQIITW